MPRPARATPMTPEEKKEKMREYARKHREKKLAAQNTFVKPHVEPPITFFPDPKPKEPEPPVFFPDPVYVPPVLPAFVSETKVSEPIDIPVKRGRGRPKKVVVPPV